jgi:hypothetical protein
VAERWYPPSAWAPPNRAALSAHEDASARMPNSWRSHTRQRKLLYHWASSRTRIGEITLGEGVVPVPDASDIGMLGHVPPPGWLPADESNVLRLQIPLPVTRTGVSPACWGSVRGPAGWAWRARCPRRGAAGGCVPGVLGRGGADLIRCLRHARQERSCRCRRGRQGPSAIDAFLRAGKAVTRVAVAARLTATPSAAYLAASW